MIRRPIALTVFVGATMAAAVALLGVLAPSPSPSAQADDFVSHHEFQVNCGVSHTAPDDPIVYPGQPGRSHNHTFLGATTTDAYSTTQSLLASPTTCLVPADHSAYWFPTLYNGDQQVLPNFKQVVYYKSGILDYKKVVPFPQGLRFVTGDMMATQDEFRTAPGAVEGFECGNISKSWDIPSYCDPGSQMNIRYQAPSCWDGEHLTPQDADAHHAGSKNMAYPVNGVCPDGFPVAVPMIEFKMAFPLSGDMSKAHFASGRGFSWHYDFFNAWEPATLDALVKHCINGGLQCDPRGFDQYKPDRGQVLDANYQLIG
ncbi:DUF1996 domain-containing protein [Glaciibacter flavus]|uniref:DUF1996 domain-containing protein n=1 Tax=Orlajensenia flava TaxID=2565934 RepID=UPI003B00B884